MDDSRFAFSIECYKQIRTEVSSQLSRIENMFRYAMIVSASVFAWVLTDAFGTTTSGSAEQSAFCLKVPAEALHLAFWIPLGFVGVGGFACLITYVRVRQMGHFLRRCEESLGCRDLSWEAFLEPRFPIFAVGSLAGWCVMLWLTYYAGSLGQDSFKVQTICQAKPANSVQR